MQINISEHVPVKTLEQLHVRLAENRMLNGRPCSRVAEKQEYMRKSGIVTKVKSELCTLHRASMHVDIVYRPLCKKSVKAEL